MEAIFKKPLDIAQIYDSLAEGAQFVVQENTWVDMGINSRIQIPTGEILTKCGGCIDGSFILLQSSSGYIFQIPSDKAHINVEVL